MTQKENKKEIKKRIFHEFPSKTDPPPEINDSDEGEELDEEVYDRENDKKNQNKKKLKSIT